MSESSIWNRERLAQNSRPDHRPGQAAAIIGVACFALAGATVTAVLMGKDVPQTANAAYFIDGNLITSGHHSLDLSRLIFVRGDVPICPSNDALANYQPDDPEGCTTLPASAPADLIGIVPDGMRQPIFQMQMNSPDGPIRGWVNYNNLTN